MGLELLQEIYKFRIMTSRSEVLCSRAINFSVKWGKFFSLKHQTK
nr:MAG TPA: hypothetical protein [Bacteriophage sp.]